MNYKNVNDYEVLYMIRESSEEAEDLLYQKYLPIIKHMAANYCLFNKDLGVDYDDYLQEAMISFSKAVSTYDENKNALFYTYATTVINKHLAHFIRHLKSSKNAPFINSLHDDGIIDNATDVSFSYVDRFFAEDFCNLKNSFSIEVSPVFELRYNGFSYKEIAVLLDIPLHTVQVRLYKIRKEIRKII